MFLELCCVPTSLLPTDTRTSHKTLPRKIHSYNPTAPFLPSLLYTGRFLAAPGEVWSGDGAGRACPSRTARLRAGRMGEHVMGTLRAMNGGDAPFINAGSRRSRAGVGNPQPAGAAPPSASKFPLIRCSCSFWLQPAELRECRAGIAAPGQSRQGCSRHRGLGIAGCLT